MARKIKAPDVEISVGGCKVDAVWGETTILDAALVVVETRVCVRVRLSHIFQLRIVEPANLLNVHRRFARFRHLSRIPAPFQTANVRDAFCVVNVLIARHGAANRLLVRRTARVAGVLSAAGRCGEGH